MNFRPSVEVSRRRLLDADPGAPVPGAGIRVVPRDHWIADLASVQDEAGRPRWPLESTAPRAVVIHHTRTENGDPFPFATLNRVLRYHSIDRGWGDIGYHFIVLDDGRIAEGRAGSLHAEPGRSPVGAHAYGANHGTIAVALLGHLEDREPTAAAWRSVERLVTHLCHHHGIDPLAGSTRVGSADQCLIPERILGHGQVGNTECPGPYVLDRIPALRSHVARVRRSVG